MNTQPIARPRESVLLVDDAPANLRALATILRHAGLEPRPVTSGCRAIEAAVADPPDLIVLDINMPEMSGFEVCRWFKQDERLNDIPVIFISGLLEAADKVEAFQCGGVDFISKPFDQAEVLARIHAQLRLRRLQSQLVDYSQQLERRVAQQVQLATASQMATIFALAKLAEVRDDDTGQHIERVQTWSKLLAQQLSRIVGHDAKLTDLFVETLYQAAPLHDIGKVGVPDAVLLKPGKLSAAEFSEIKKHCELGARTLEAVVQRYPDNQFLRMGIQVARSHHEKWDGSGYPDGLQGDAIPLPARIVAVADFYDALTSKRCYRPAFSHDETCAMVEQGCGTHFDPAVVTAFRALSGGFAEVRNKLRG